MIFGRVRLIREPFPFVCEWMVAADDPSVPEKEMTALKKMMNECG